MGALDETPLLARHRLTVFDYHRMGEAGVLAMDARVELIDGEVIDMAPIGTSHGSVVMRLTALVTAAVGNSVIVSVQGALRLGDLSEPQPDLMLLKARDDFYAEVHPTAADVILLIEVADTSARYDREVKMPLYARHGIAEVWLIDLKSRIVHFYRRPEGDHWTDITATQTPGPTPVAALPATIIDLTRVLV